MSQETVDVVQPVGKKSRYLWYVVGFVLCVLSVANHWNVAVAAFVWPFCFLHVVRSSEKPVGSLALVWGLMLVADAIKYVDTFEEASNWLCIPVGALIALLQIIPFILDSVFAKRLKGVSSTLVFPLAFATVDMVQLLKPLTQSNLGFSQIDNLPLLQTASILGILSLTFLVAWAAPVCEDALVEYSKNKSIAKSLVSYIAVLVGLSFYGGLRLSFATPVAKVNTVRVATAHGTSDNSYLEAEEEIAPPLTDVISDVRHDVAAAKAVDAQILVWSEETYQVYARDEKALLAEVQQLAKANEMYLLIGLDIHPGLDAPEDATWYNQSYLYGPDGTLQWKYVKNNLVPLMEEGYYDSAQAPAVVDTPYGKIASMICYDADHPNFVAKIPPQTDLLLLPSWDWKAITWNHTSTVVNARAVEQGVNMIRCTLEGQTIAVNYLGERLSESDGYTTSKDLVGVVDIPVQGRVTVYSYIDKVVNWLWPVALLALCLYAGLRTKHREK